MSDRYTVNIDGEDDTIEVFNHVTVSQEHYLNSINGYDTFTGPIQAGDGGIGKPDAITERVAALLESEFGIWQIELDKRGIRVVDMDSPEVERL